MCEINNTYIIITPKNTLTRSLNKKIYKQIIIKTKKNENIHFWFVFTGKMLKAFSGAASTRKE